MIVITADQRSSRTSTDQAGPTLATLNSRWRDHLLLPAERTAGDEIQLLVDIGSTALSIALDLTRSKHWSVGIGVGAVRHPLGEHVRESTGPAFIAAREAVTRAKSAPTHCAVASDPTLPLAADTGALLDLLLILRERRSAEGWELHDLLQSGLPQQEAAARLGITPQAASQRARVASLRTEEAATVALANLLDTLITEASTGADN